MGAVALENTMDFAPNNLTTVRKKKTIVLGIYKSVEELKQDLRSAEHSRPQSVTIMLDAPEFVLTSKPVEIDLVALSAHQLGFKDTEVPYQLICARAIARGYELCPAETALQLRLQYPEQPNYEILYIAMKAIPSTGGRLGIFTVLNWEDQLELNQECCEFGKRFKSYDTFVWVLPRK